MSGKNYPKLALQFFKKVFVTIFHALYIIFVEEFGLILMLAFIGAFSYGAYQLSQLPAETLEIEKEIVVDSVRADMSAIDNKLVAVVVTETGLNIELRDRGPISAGDTIGIYSRGDEVCNTSVKKKSYDSISDTPHCSRIENTYKP